VSVAATDMGSAVLLCGADGHLRHVHFVGVARCDKSTRRGAARLGQRVSPARLERLRILAAYSAAYIRQLSLRRFGSDAFKEHVELLCRGGA
jgi:hypothetical protein